MALLGKRTMELGDGVLVDVDPKSEFVNFRVGENRGILVKKVDLWAMCFSIADAKTQEQLMPVRQTEMVTYRRLHNVKITKGIKPGEFLKVKCEINVPQVIEEGLAGTLVKRRNPGKVIIPIS